MKTAAAVGFYRQRTCDVEISSSSSIWRVGLENEILPYQREVRWFYLLPRIQILVAVVILLNFATAAAQAQILPEKNSPNSQIFLTFEYFYVYLFLVELVINLYGHWWCAFWRSGWNWFDFIIVIVSLLSLYFPDIPAVSVLRLFRAFRVVRLFKRVKEMKTIIEGILRSLVALSWAFGVMSVIMGIWGIIGVDLFGDIVSEDTKGNLIRGYYFGDFFSSILTLGQITTFDSWTSGIAREIINHRGFLACIYFSTYVFVGSIVLMNVLVALLLDSYLYVDTNSDDVISLCNPVDITPESVFKELVSYVTRTEIDITEFSGFLDISISVHEVLSKKKSEPKSSSLGNTKWTSCTGFKESQTIAASLRSIENQLNKLRKTELEAYDLAGIPKFSFIKKLKEEEVYILPYQKETKWFYSQPATQIIVSFFIFLNFLTTAIHMQLLPEKGTKAERNFVAFEYFYTYCFLVELLINWYGSFFCGFFLSGWNIFDLLVVGVSLVAINITNIQTITVLRIFKAFRVVRLFKRVDGMKNIMIKITSSLPSLSYAFIALGLITGIWAIMGVDFFSEMVHNDKQGYYFGSFSKSFLSLVQITTFDSWNSEIARDIVFRKGAGSAFYFVTYIFFSSIIMMNVLIALFLDSYLSPIEEKDDAVLNAEEAMAQLSTYVKEKDLDLSDFADYLRDNGFPDFISRYQNVEYDEFSDVDHLKDEKAINQPNETGEIEMVVDLRRPIPFGDILEYLGDMGTTNLAVNRSSLTSDMSFEKSSKPEGGHSGKTNPQSPSVCSIGVLCSSDISDISL